MSPRRADEIERLTRGWSRGGQVAQELKRLPSQLRSGERLVNLDRAESAGRVGLLAVTDRRLLFLYDWLFRKIEESYPYGDLSSIECVPQLLGGRKLVLDVHTATVELRKLDAERAERIVKYVKERLASPDLHAPVPVPPREAEGDQVDAVKRMLGPAALVAGPLLRRLPGLLGVDEQVGAAAYGTLGVWPGVVVATGSRLLFVAAHPDQDVDVPYTRMQSIELEGEGRMRTLAVVAKPDPVRISAVPAKPGEAVVEHARARIARRRAAPKPKGAAKPRRPEPEAVVDAQPKPQPRRRGGAPRPTAPVNVNAATADEIRDALGLSAEIARTAVQLRGERGGYRDARDFADALGLAPHVSARVRPLVRTDAPSEPWAGPRQAGDIDPL